MPNEFPDRRTFDEADQQWFAAATGDINPMHMDALVARRTMAGKPVVHGIHALLWAIDRICAAEPALADAVAIKVAFEKMIYVGDTIHVVPVRLDADKARFEVAIGDTAVIAMEFERTTATVRPTKSLDGEEVAPTVPAELTFEEMEDQRGWIGLPTSPIVERFPAAVAALGAERVVALARTSYLIGMVCPGLHSIFRGLHLSRVTPADGPSVLRFHVAYADEDYRLIRLGVAGGGWNGIVDGYARPEPSRQATIATIAPKVVASEFAGTRPLIVGGSRGLGEVVAKILAAGGAEVTITYVTGEVDARRVRDEIRAFGGRCEMAQYDVRSSAAEQVAALAMRPTDLYFMSTPQIFGRAETSFSSDKLRGFMDFYVHGFADLCDALRQTVGKDIGIFYPSSVSIDERPANMTEYTMAKAAGEVLCADMRSFGGWQRITVDRLPRLPTDQTATLYDDDAADPVDAMLPIVRAVQRR